MKLHTKSKNDKSKKNNKEKANIAIAILEKIFVFLGAPINKYFRRKYINTYLEY